MRLRFWQKEIVPSAREVRDDWLEWLRLSNFSEATIAGYRRTTDILLRRYPELTFAEFNDDHIQGVVEESRPASRPQKRGAFANWFGWGLRTKRIARNPMVHVPVYKQQKPPPIETFTEAEQKILCALPEPDGTLCALLLGSGIRKSEATNLTVRRVDLQRAELHVVEGAKGGSIGVVPLGARLVSRLAEFFIVEGLNADDFLWYSHRGGSNSRLHDRRLAPAAMHVWWGRVIEAAAIPYRHLHTTRHTYAEEIRRRGVSLDDLGFVLRHRDARTTERVYAHTKLVDIRERMAQAGALQ